MCVNCSLGVLRDGQSKVREIICVILQLAIPSVCLTKHKTCSSSLSLFFFLSSTSPFHLQPDVFGHVRCKKKMQEGEEERKDSSKGIWLVLIWKYYFSSSEQNYCSELTVLGE